MAADEDIDSRYIDAKKEFLSKDAVNVSTDEKDGTECCNHVNPTRNNIHRRKRKTVWAYPRPPF